MNYFRNSMGPVVKCLQSMIQVFFNGKATEME